MMDLIHSGKQDLSNPGLDSFGRSRVSQPTTVFDANFKYGVEERLFNTALTGGASATFLPNEAAWALTAGTANGDVCERQTYEYFAYQPGKSTNVLLTGCLTPKTNVWQELGLYDSGDGIFFRHDGTQMNVVIRSSVTGSVVERVFPQAQWNYDTLDGNGNSGITIDWTKSQLFMLDLAWLGVGRVRFGIYANGSPLYFHVVSNENVITSVYMRTAYLPVKYRIENKSAQASSTTLKQICSTVASEGGSSKRGNLWTANSGYVAAPITTGVWKPLISLQVPTTYNGLTNRSKAFLNDIQTLVTGTNSVMLQIIVNGTLTGATWRSVDPASFCLYDASATAVTGGQARFTAFVPPASKGDSGLSTFENDAAMYPGTTITLVGRGTGTSSIFTAINWREVY